MKILYLDLGVNHPRENYSQNNAKGYGGASCFARYALTLLNNREDIFHILGPEESFQDVTREENNHCCFPMTEDQMSFLRNGGNIRDIFNSIDNYDIAVFHHDCLLPNFQGCKPKLVHWSLMSSPGANGGAPYALMYNPGTKSNIGKSFKVLIGKYVPSFFIPGEKDNYIFQCSRHDRHMNTIEVAKWCLENNFKGIFAGPILDNYPLMDYIDGSTTKYLGSITDKLKMQYTRNACVTTYLHTWDTAFNLSAIESLSVGTPIIASRKGCFNYLVKEGINGYFWQIGDELGNLMEKCKDLDQNKIWETALPFSHTSMVESFYSAFENILKE